MRDLPPYRASRLQVPDLVRPLASAASKTSSAALASAPSLDNDGAAAAETAKAVRARIDAASKAWAAATAALDRATAAVDKALQAASKRATGRGGADIPSEAPAAASALAGSKRRRTAASDAEAPSGSAEPGGAGVEEAQADDSDDADEGDDDDKPRDGRVADPQVELQRLVDSIAEQTRVITKEAPVSAMRRCVTNVCALSQPSCAGIQARPSLSTGLCAHGVGTRRALRGVLGAQGVGKLCWRRVAKGRCRRCSSSRYGGRRASQLFDVSRATRHGV